MGIPPTHLSSAYPSHSLPERLGKRRTCVLQVVRPKRREWGPTDTLTQTMISICLAVWDSSPPPLSIHIHTHLVLSLQSQATGFFTLTFFNWTSWQKDLRLLRMFHRPVYMFFCILLLVFTGYSSCYIVQTGLPVISSNNHNRPVLAS